MNPLLALAIAFGVSEALVQRFREDELDQDLIEEIRRELSRLNAPEIDLQVRDWMWDFGVNESVGQHVVISPVPSRFDAEEWVLMVQPSENLDSPEVQAVENIYPMIDRARLAEAVLELEREEMRTQPDGGMRWGMFATAPLGPNVDPPSPVPRDVGWVREREGRRVSDHTWEIERDDEVGFFADDAEAVDYVADLLVKRFGNIWSNTPLCANLLCLKLALNPYYPWPASHPLREQVILELDDDVGDLWEFKEALDTEDRREELLDAWLALDHPDTREAAEERLEEIGEEVAEEVTIPRWLPPNEVAAWVDSGSFDGYLEAYTEYDDLEGIIYEGADPRPPTPTDVRVLSADHNASDEEHWFDDDDLYPLLVERYDEIVRRVALERM